MNQITDDDISRALFNVTLETISAVGVRTGKVDDDISTLKIAVDCKDNPYIPGSTLRGLLRSLWHADEANPSDKSELAELFGIAPTETNDQASNKEPETKRGLLTVRNAYLSGKNRGVQTLGQTRIDDRTGAAFDGSLRHVEVIEKGTSFEWEILVETRAGTGLDRQSLNRLRSMLLSASERGDLIIGGGKSSGSGVLSVKGITCSIITKEALTQWWKDKETPLEWTEIRLGKVEIQHSEPCLDWDINIEFDGPFLIGAPASDQGREDKKKDKGPLEPLNEAQIGALAGTTVKGALRAQCSRILKTLNTADDKVNELLGAIFGSTNRTGMLRLSAPGMTNDAPLQHLEFVAIDRMTGGAADGRKFSAKAYVDPIFKMKIALYGKLSEEHFMAGAALLRLALRDGEQGDIPLGRGKYRGMGHCRWEVSGEPEGLSAENHEALMAFCHPEQEAD